MKETNLLSGVLYSAENTPVIFSVDRDTFEFNFYTNSIYPHEEDNGYAFLKANDNYIFGQTHQGNNVAIFTGSRGLGVEGHQRVFTSTYVVSSSCIKPQNLSTYTGIRFVGGTLNAVFPTNYFRYCYADNKITVEKKSNKITHSIITTQYHMHWSIKAPDSDETGLDGVPINNPDVFVDILFDSPQPLSTLSHHYNKLKELLSFMTYRFNVGFRSIELIEKDIDNGILVKQADVYVQEESDLTEKEHHYNITFHDLGETAPTLIGLLYDTEDQKPSYSLGFYPNNDRELHRISSARVREVCSAIECELSFLADLNQTGDVLLSNLISRVKDEVKAFRKDNDGLSQDTYNMIFSSIGNWSFTLAEKLITLYSLYSTEIETLNHFSYQVTEKDLRAFVKYRNHITHGTHRILEPSIGVTTHLLCGLVYCCLLKRIGLPQEKILELCQEKKITT